MENSVAKLLETYKRFNNKQMISFLQFFPTLLEKFRRISLYGTDDAIAKLFVT